MQQDQRYPCAHCNEPHAHGLDKYAGHCSPECHVAAVIARVPPQDHARGGERAHAELEKRYGRRILPAPTLHAIRWQREGRRDVWLARRRAALEYVDQQRALQADASDEAYGGVATKRA